MRSTTSCRAVLVIAGGFPGEWEGEHPYDTVQRLGAEGVFFVGWKDHDELAELSTAATSSRLRPSTNRSDWSISRRWPAGFRRSPPAPVDRCRSSTSIPLIRPGGSCRPTTSPQRRERSSRPSSDAGDARGCAARTRHSSIREHYSWAASAEAFARLYDEVIDECRPIEARRRRGPTGRRAVSRRTGSRRRRRRAAGARSTGRRGPRPTAGCVSRLGRTSTGVDRERNLALHRPTRRRRATRDRRANRAPIDRPTSATPPHRR